jgi:hypothetical protein
MRKNTEKTQNTWLRLLASGLRDQKKKKRLTSKTPSLNPHLKIPRLTSKGKKRCRRPLKFCSEK